MKKKHIKYLELYCLHKNRSFVEYLLGYSIQFKKSHKAYIRQHWIKTEYELSTDATLRGMYAITNADPSNYFYTYISEEYGELQIIKKPQYLSDEMRSAVKDTKYNAKGTLLAYSFHDKLKALEIIMKHKGLFPKEPAAIVQVNVADTSGEQLTLEEARKTALELGVPLSVLTR